MQRLLHPDPRRIKTMFLKMFRCCVPAAHRPLFLRGQYSWQQLSEVKGFIAQVCGFEMTRPDVCTVTALWKDRDSYEKFMRDVHDEIYYNNGQKGTFTDSSVLYASSVLFMPGDADSLRTAVAGAGLLRIADCTVRRDCESHFESVQSDIWLPGMRNARGMLGGVFWKVRDRTVSRYLVTTFWTDLQAHEHYRQEMLPRLREQAEPEKDLTVLRGCEIQLHTDYTVTI